MLTGLDEYTILDAFEDDGVLVVEVIATRPEAPCPGCGTFSGRVKSYRLMTVIDAAGHGRRCRLRVRRRAFRCVTPGCVRRSFTESTDQVPVRARITTRARTAMGRAGRDRSTISVADEFGVSWPTAWRAIRAAARHSITAWGGTRRAPRRLGIDETRFWWRQPWLTGLVDLDTGVLIDVVTGRDAGVIRPGIRGCS